MIGHGFIFFFFRINVFYGTVRHFWLFKLLLISQQDFLLLYLEEKGCAFPPPITFLFLDKATWRGEDLLPETDGCFLLMPHKRLRVQKKGIFNSAELTICVHFTVSCFPDMFTLQMLQLMAMTYFEW